MIADPDTPATRDPPRGERDSKVGPAEAKKGPNGESMKGYNEKDRVPVDLVRRRKFYYVLQNNDSARSKCAAISGHF
jgi:hypothetical protein